MPTPTSSNLSSPVVSAPVARASLGKLLNRLDDEGGSLVIEQRGTPRAVLLSLRDYVKLAAPEPEILKIIGEQSKRNGTDTLTPKQIDRLIRSTRADRKKNK